jgi:hypothetical protein
MTDQTTTTDRDIGFPPTPGMPQALRRLEAGYDAAERRQQRRAPIAEPFALKRLQRASQRFLDAFGGDTPDWLRAEAEELAAALASISAPPAPLGPAATSLERAEAVLSGVEWEMNNFLPGQGESSSACERRRLADAIATEIDEVRAEYAGAERDKARLDYLQNEYRDLRCFPVPTGGDDADIGWRLVGHWQAEPQERTVAEVFHDNLRDAIDQGIASERRRPSQEN